MDRLLDDALGIADEGERPVPYIERTHAWYGALGYGNPYRYAQYTEVPFTRLQRPLTSARVVLLTTAAPYQPDKGDQSARAPYNAAAKFYAVYSGDSATDHDLRVSHVGGHRAHLVDDTNCWFPLPALRRAVAAGRIGSVAPRFHGVPTNRSQRHTLEVDAPQVLSLLEAAPAPRATVQNPLRWSGSPTWRQDYLNVQRLSTQELAQRRADNDRIKAVAQGVRDATLQARP